MATDDEAGARHAAGPARIRLPQDAFDELAAGGGSPVVIRQLEDGQRSRRLILLRALLEAASEDPASCGPLPTTAQAWSDLESIQQRAPGAVDSVLLHPQVGSWLAYVLRRHRGGTAASTPSYVDFGQLNTVVLAGAAIAGLPYRTRVPLRHGRVMVPRHGMAVFDGCKPWDVAEAWTTNGRITLRHEPSGVEISDQGDSAGWLELRQVTVGDDLGLTVFLDDLDPWRDLADPIGPARLSDAQYSEWCKLLQDAWAILTEHHRPLAEALAVGVTSLVPLPTGDGWDTRSASTGDAFGAVMCSLPPDPVRLAVSLAHEFMHIKLGALMHLVSLTHGPGDPCLYAPWRDDPRPAGGLLQGIYAFYGIANFWRTQRRAAGSPHPKLDDFEYAYSREQTREALAIALADGNLTADGRLFAERLAAGVADWSGDELDEEATDLARLVADSHRSGWRIRHCRPDDQSLASLAESWPAGSPRPPDSAPAEVRPDPDMRHWSAARLGLARRRLIAPDRFAEARTSAWGADLSEGDLALFAGQPGRAAHLFAAQLENNPGALDAWTGLGLALRRAGHLRTGGTLLDRPDIALALYRRLAPAGPTPTALVHWLAGTAPSDAARATPRSLE